MRKTVIALLLLSLGGCFGTRRQPDEFSVISAPPLTYPPSYAALPAPKENTAVRETGDPDNSAARATRGILSGETTARQKPKFDFDKTSADREFMDKF